MIGSSELATREASSPSGALTIAVDPARRRRRPGGREVAVVDVDPVRRRAGVDLRRVALAAVGDRLRVRVGLHVGEPPGRPSEREGERARPPSPGALTPDYQRLPATAAAKTLSRISFGDQMPPCGSGLTGEPRLVDPHGSRRGTGLPPRPWAGRGRTGVPAAEQPVTPTDNENSHWFTSGQPVRISVAADPDQDHDRR